MSDTEETKEPRRLKHIRAGEVSLVDRGANGKTFAVTKRLEEDEMGKRAKIDLDAKKADEKEEEETEKDAAPDADVTGDAAATKAEDGAEETSEEDADAEGEEDAEKSALSDAVADLAPWLEEQMADAPDELKTQIAAVLEGAGSEDAPEDSEDSEKADELSELKAAVAQLQAAEKAAEEGEDEEDEEDAEKSVSKSDSAQYVTKADFDAFKKDMMSTMKDAVEGITKVSKRLNNVESIQPVSKGADDIAPTKPGTPAGGQTSSVTEAFSGLFG